tara:strand:- start:543 stop:653 length:111 start_codon:yes stop_codon:yes gene_type:complete
MFFATFYAGNQIQFGRRTVQMSREMAGTHYVDVLER